MKLFFVFLSVVILNFNVSAQEKWTDFILPVSLVAIGSYGVSSSSFHSLNSDIKDKMEDLRDGDYMNFDDYLQYFPAISSLFLEYMGVPSEYNVSQRLLLTLTSVVILRASVTLTKDNVAEKRPDFSAKTSFPSGHTATAFMGAELIRQEYGLCWGLAAYTMATGVAFMRLYNERHWFNDVIAGAGFGILSAKLAHLLLPLEERLFKSVFSSKASITFLPSYNYGGTCLSFSLRYQL